MNQNTQNNQRTLSHRWIHSDAIGTLIISVGYIIFFALLYADSQNFPLVASVFAISAIASALYALTIIINRTIITLNADAIHITTAPIKLRHQSIPARSIESIRLDTRQLRFIKPRHTQLKHNIIAYLKNGSRVNVLSNIRSTDFANTIHNSLNTWLTKAQAASST